VELTQCPFDGTALTVECASGAMLLSCGSCDAIWERHGARIGPIREPDHARVRQAREVDNQSEVQETSI